VDKVRIGCIRVGSRGSSLLGNLLHIEGVAAMSSRELALSQRRDVVPAGHPRRRDGSSVPERSGGRGQGMRDKAPSNGGASLGIGLAGPLPARSSN